MSTTFNSAATGTAPEELPYWVAFSHVPGIGPARFSSLLQHFGDVRRAWLATRQALLPVLDARAALSLRGIADTGENPSSRSPCGATCRLSDPGSSRVAVLHPENGPGSAPHRSALRPG